MATHTFKTASGTVSFDIGGEEITPLRQEITLTWDKVNLVTIITQIATITINTTVDTTVIDDGVAPVTITPGADKGALVRDALKVLFPDANTGSGSSGTNTGDETKERINALYGYTPANAATVATNTTNIATNTADILTKLGFENSATYAAISSARTDLRLIVVATDETASGAINQIYLFSGATKLGQLLIY